MTKKILILTFVCALVLSIGVYADEVVEQPTEPVVEEATPAETPEPTLLDDIIAQLDPETVGEEPTLEEVVQLAIEQGLVDADGNPYTVEGLTAKLEEEAAAPEADILDDIMALLDPDLISEDATLEEIIQLAVDSGLLNEAGEPYTVEELTALIEAGEELTEEAFKNQAQERIALAKELGITPGKMNLIQKLMASEESGTIDAAAWKDAPVKDIMQAIKANRKNEGDDDAVIDEELDAVDDEAGTDALNDAEETQENQDTDKKNENKEKKNNSKSKSGGNGKGKKK